MTDRRGIAEHWYIDDQFERQLGSPAQAAIIRRRWDAFASALRSFSGARADGLPLRVLDAGCGDGINLVGLRQVLADLGLRAQLVATDMSPVRVNRVVEAGRAPGRVALGSVTALPFATGTFDVVLCNHVIEHVPGPAAAVAEIARVLRSGGLAIIGVPNEGCLLARLRNHVFQRSILKATDHVNFFTGDSLSRLLSRGGLAVREVQTEGFFLPHLRLLGIARATAAGRAALEGARRLLPGQAAGLMAVATRAS